MKNIIIRKAQAADSDTVARYLKKMLLDMQSYGGYRVTDSAKNWQEIRENLKLKLEKQEHFFLIGEDLITEKTIAYAEARIIEIDLFFEAFKQMHISAVYLEPAYRGQGIGKLLMQEILRLGREHHCQEADLNVLLHNPAYYLYKSMGFNEFKSNMRLKL